MMINRSIGIDIGSDYLRAAQIVGVSQEFRVEKFFSTATRRASDSVPDILRSLFGRHGFDKHAEVAVSMPHDAVFFRNIRTDSAGLDRLRRCDSAALPNSFPIPTEDIVAQVCSYYELSEGEYSVLTAAVNRESFDDVRRTLAKAHIRYGFVAAPVFGMLAALEANHPQLTKGRSTVVYLDGPSLTLAVIAQSDVVMVRNIPVGSASEGDTDLLEYSLAETIISEIQITWQRTFGQAIDADANVFLLSDPQEQDKIRSLVESRLNCTVTIAEPPAFVEGSSEGPASLSCCVAAGLALSVSAPGNISGINFLDADRDDDETSVNVKKELATYSAFAAVFIVLLVVGLFAQLSRLESAYADVKTRINDTFKAALPEEKNIVSPLAQMEQKLESFRKEHRLAGSLGPGALSPLRVLQNISRVAPAGADLVVDNLLIAGDSARIVGTCDSFEAVYQWQRLLQEVPGFTQVEAKDVQRVARSGKAQFTMIISFQEQETE
ncbi:MAG: PilN domain-containing protein [Planctomycetota bacterium]|jgi:hypothetical protein